MTRAILGLSCALILAACTTVKLHGDTNSITYSGGPEVGQDLAARACRKAGEARAIIISTINKDASLPPGTGRQVTTFRCTSAETKPPASQPSS